MFHRTIIPSGAVRWPLGYPRAAVQKFRPGSAA